MAVDLIKVQGIDVRFGRPVLAILASRKRCSVKQGRSDNDLGM